jgi:hypothetical protein
LAGAPVTRSISLCHWLAHPLLVFLSGFALGKMGNIRRK